MPEILSYNDLEVVDKVDIQQADDPQSMAQKSLSAQLGLFGSVIVNNLEYYRLPSRDASKKIATLALFAPADFTLANMIFPAGREMRSSEGVALTTKVFAGGVMHLICLTSFRVTVGSGVQALLASKWEALTA